MQVLRRGELRLRMMRTPTYEMLFGVMNLVRMVLLGVGMMI